MQTLQKQKTQIQDYIDSNALPASRTKGVLIHNSNDIIDFQVNRNDFSAHYKILGRGGIYSISILNYVSQMGSHCTCPYNWGGICKHEVAALMHLDNYLTYNSTNVSVKLPVAKKAKSSTEPYSIPDFSPLTRELIRRHSPEDKQLYSGNRYHQPVKFDSLKGNTISFKHEGAHWDEPHYTVTFEVTGKKLITTCSCNKKVAGLCPHQVGALHFILDDWNNEDFFDNLLPERIKKREKQHLIEFGLSATLPAVQGTLGGEALQSAGDRVSPSALTVAHGAPAETAFEKYFTTEVNNGVLVFVPNDKYQGIQRTKSFRTATENEMVTRFVDRPDRDELNLLKPVTTGLSQNIREIGYVFRFQSKEGDWDDPVHITPISGKTNKDGTKLASHIKELHRLRYDETLNYTENDDQLIPLCDQLAEGLASDRFNSNDIRNVDSEKRYLNTQKYCLDKLQKIIPLLEEKKFIYTTGSQHYGELRKSDIYEINVSSVPAELEFELFEEDPFIVLQAYIVLNNKRIKLLPENPLQPQFLFTNIDNTYHLNKSVNQSVAFAHFAENPVMKVVKKDFEHFFNDMVKPIAKNFNIDIKKIKGMKKEAIQLSPIEKRIYISELGNFVLFKPMIKYDHGQEVEVLNKSTEPLEKKNGMFYIYKRDEEYEDDFIEFIKTLHPRFTGQFRSDFFNLTMDEMINNGWFFNAFEKLSENNIEVYGLKDLKNFRYSPHKAKVNVNLISGEDWFDVHIEVVFGNVKISLAEVRKAVMRQERYIKLSDGSIGVLPEEWLRKFEGYFRNGEVENEKIKISKLRFSIIDELFENIDDKKLLKELIEKRKKIREFTKIKNARIPQEITATLRDYQKEGYKWINFLNEFKWGGILADDMGLGKTLQVLTFLQQQVKKSKKANLIVLPTSLMFNWKNEIEKFSPALTAHFHYGNKRIKNHKIFKNYNLIFTTYGLLVKDIEVLKKYKFNYAILDESQAIKNPFSKRYKAACLLRAENKLTLTGTPIENSTFDLYAQMNFVNPGFLGSMASFKENYSIPIDKERNVLRSKELQRLISPFILRRTKEQVAKELPAKTEDYLYCTMKEEQRKTYDAYRNKYRDYLMNKIKNDGLAKSKLHVLAGLMKLRQICDSPELLSDDEDYGTESVKINELIMHIREKTSGHKILVFSQFVKMLGLIKEQLKAHDIDFEYLDGKCSTKQREESVNRFQSEQGCRVFLISLKAGGQGLNLTAADYVYIVDPWWNPAVENQAIDRCHRIGQDKKVIAYRMICKDTIEEKIMNYQARKKQIASEIIQTDESFIKQLKQQDIAELFG